MKKKILVLLIPVLATFSTLLLSSEVSAATVPSTVKYKAAYEGVYQCLKSGAAYAWFTASSGGAGMLKDSLGGDAVKLPYGLTDATDNNTNCKEILKGFNSDARSDDNLRAGLMQAGMWSETDQIAVKNYFSGTNGEGGAGTMGYEAEGSGNVENEQTTSKLTIGFDTSKINAETCRKKGGATTIIGTQSFYDESGKTYSELIFPTITKDNTGNWFFGDVASNSNGINVPKPGSGGMSFYYFCNDDSWIQISDSGSQNSPYYNINVVFTTYYMGVYDTIESSSLGVQQELVTASGSKGWNYTANTRLFNGTITEGKVEETGDFDDYKLTYRKLDGSNYSSTYMRTIAKLSATSAAGYNLSLNSSSTYDALKLDEKEIYALYTYYVKDVFKYPVLCEGDANFSAYNDSNSKKVNWASGKTCRIDTAAAASSPSYKVYGIDNGTKHFTKEVSIDDVITALNALPDNISEQVADGETGGNIPDGTESGENTDTPGSPNGDENGGEAAENPCYNAGASLGWIVCPVLDITGKAVVGIYDMVIQPFLEIKSEWLGNGSNSVYSGWKQFRDFANIFFVIGFAVIILAQLTGIGISNYNIKKILPRFIMVVVLVNLSYVICQLAVDISNILGSGLQNLFADMATKVDVPPEIGSKTVEIYGGGGATATWFSLGGVLSTGLTVLLGGAAIWGLAVTWEFWLIPFLLTVLGCIIGVLFFFILLGVRQAGVLVLTALAPVAIVCYALPNTKSLFDKWRRMYQGLLIVYPICGAMIGGGQFASALMITAGGGSNFFYDLVAMLIQVVPFFFIPSILKSSMAAMGNLGMKISGIGRQVSGFARKTVGNARPVQERQREWARSNNQRRDARLADRYQKLAEKTNKEVKGYEDSMRTAGVNINDPRAVRRFLGDKYGEYRRVKNRAATINYRTNQARRRYESSVMEDATAAVGASRELLTPGSKRYESYMEGLESAQRVKDATDQRKLYEAGRVNGVNAGKIIDPDHDVMDPENEDSLAREHLRLLEQLRDEPENVEARAKLEAVQDMLAERGDKGHEAMFSNYESVAASSDDEQLKSNGLRYAANHLSRYAGQIKKGNRSFDKLLNQYQAGTVKSFRDSAAADGKTIGEQLSGSSALGYNASSFNDMNDNAIQKYIDMAKAGKLSGEQLHHLTSIANEALNNDQIQLKGDVEKKLHEFLEQAYGTGAVGHSAAPKSVATTGSTAMGRASVESLNGIAQRIQSGKLEGAAATKVVENARRYMESGDLVSEDRAQALKKIISTAQTKGISSIDGGTDNFNYDQTSFKVRGAKATAKMPTGWTRNVAGTWVDITSGNPLSAADARKAEEIEKYNNQRDIESGKYS